MVGAGPAGETVAGRVTLTDALALGADCRGHQLGKAAPLLLIRRLECVTDTVDDDIEYTPAAEYGLVSHLLSNVEGSYGGRRAEWLVLTSPRPLDLDVGTGRVCVTSFRPR